MNPQRHVIFGSAGHVDHGKSTLVLALTGTDPDRLAEEKAREMTIDLGFAFLSLPGIAEKAAIVDVPGHEMFLRNMVAGASGIDAAIFVIAADEGVMPQSVEHLDVLRQLRISEGVIVLTKSDKAPDNIAKVSEEVRELVRGSFLEGARILPVSSITKEGIPALIEELARIASRVKVRSTTGIFRLPIDRVFTIKGAGTVITGTAISGSLKAGENVECLPQGLKLRARSLQVHNEQVMEIFAGQRAAINLADAGKEELARGNVLATPGALAPSLMLDVRLEHSSDAPRPLVQRARVRIHHGTNEVMARVVLLEREQLAAGESAPAQLRLETPIVAVAGDSFVMRSYSPMRVIGGGTIIDPHPPKRKKTGGADEVETREVSETPDVILGILDRAGTRGEAFANVQLHSGVSESELRETFALMKSKELAAEGRRDTWYSAGAIREMQTAIAAGLARLHAKEPLRPYARLNDLAAVAAASPESKECFRIALDALIEKGGVVSSGEKIRLSSHKPQWVGKYAAAREKLLMKLRESGLAAPSVSELALHAGLSESETFRALDALVEAEELILLEKGVYIHPEVFAQGRERVKEFIAENGRMNIAQARELLGASRKFLLPFLEMLDRQGVTRREGDYRVAKL